MVTAINVFVSYSHADAPLVSPVVRLLRANKALVFQDVDSIRPGKKWREEIAAALGAADQIYVFWCDHAKASTEVTNEWEAALAQNKDVIPVLLDGTPLPPSLAEFQWIDFRDMVAGRHGQPEERLSEHKVCCSPVEVKVPSAAPEKVFPWFLVIVMLLGISALILWAIMPAGKALPNLTELSLHPNSNLVLAGTGIAASVYFLRALWRQYCERRESRHLRVESADARNSINDVAGDSNAWRAELPCDPKTPLRDPARDRAMAVQLEAEILARSTRMKAGDGAR